MNASFNIPEKIDGIPVYELAPDFEREGDGFTVISFVEAPANKKAFIALSEGSPQDLPFDSVKLSISPEKHEVTGVIMRANFPILRIHPETKKPYYFFMTPEMIEQSVEVFMENKLTDSVSVDHNGVVIQGVFLKNTFFMSDEYRSMYPEFEDVENGSWMGTYKVKNEVLWNRILNGNIHGYSPEIAGNLLEHRNQRHVAELSELIEINNILNLTNRING